MRTYLLYFFACLRLSDINVKPIKKEERHHYSCAKVVFLFQKNAQQSEKTLITPNLAKIYSKKTDIFSPLQLPQGERRLRIRAPTKPSPLGELEGASLIS